MNPVIIDVRELDEFEAEHIEKSIHVPLSNFNHLAPGVLAELSANSEVLIMCRSGARSKLALDQIKNLGYNDKIQAKVYEGGILAWKAAGYTTIVKKANHLPIMRQVQLIAGSVVLLSSLASVWINPMFVWVAAFFGTGLTIAGLTGFCGMAQLLSLAPWNRTHATTKEELCCASPKSPECKD